jgi:hypothetical protein
LLGLLHILRRLARHLEAGLVRQSLDRFGEREVLRLHHEGEDVAVLAAGEAVIEALVVVDGEGGGLFVGERAETDELLAAPNQPRAPANQRGDRNAGTDLIQKLRRKRHRTRTLPTKE